ncbi:MAG: WD40 repeat domain-containing protein [Limisphaerales bacterium]
MPGRAARHRDEVRRLAFLPDNKTLVSGGKDGMVCFWDTSVTHPRQENIHWPEKINQWSFGPDGQSVLTYNGEVACWTGTDFREKEPLLKFGTDGFVASGFSGHGRFFLFSNTNGTSLWGVSQKVRLHQLTNVILRVEAKNNWILSGPVTYLSERNKLITRWPAARLHELDPTTGSEIQSWSVPITVEGTGITGFSPDERLCVTIDTEGNVVGRNLVDKTDGTLPLDMTTPSDFAFSEDGRLFAAASRDFKYVRVWDAKTWQEVVTLRGFVRTLKR